MTEDEEQDFVNAFTEDFAALVRRYFPSYAKADSALLARCQDMTSMYSPYVWGDENTPARSADRMYRALNDAARRLAKAEVADAWKGAGDPEDIPEIEQELEAAKRHFKNVAMRCTASMREHKILSATKKTPLMRGNKEVGEVRASRDTFPATGPAFTLQPRYFRDASGPVLSWFAIVEKTDDQT